MKNSVDRSQAIFVDTHQDIRSAAWTGHAGLCPCESRVIRLLDRIKTPHFIINISVILSSFFCAWTDNELMIVN